MPIRFTASCLFFPSFSCLLTHSLSPTGLSRSFRPTRSLASPPLFATTQSVIPAHSVYCVFSFSLSCLCATWAQSVIPAHSVPCCLRTCFHFSLLCFSTTALTQSVIPAHSVFGFLPLALLLSIIFTVFHGLDSVGHSGPLGLWLPFHLFSLLFSWFLSFPTTALTLSVTPAHSVSGNLISFSFFRFSLFFFTFACTQSVIPAHSVFGFLPLALLLSIFFSVFHSLDSVGHSGPLGLWLPFHLFSLLFSWFLGFPTTALTQSVIPAHSVSGNLISFSFFRFSLFFFTLACTQCVIPAGDSCGKGGTSDDLCLP